MHKNYTKWEVKAPKRFGKQVKVRRECEGLTQTKVAECTGYSNRHISSVERGAPHLETDGISVNCAITLAQFFGIPKHDTLKRRVR